MSIFTHRDDPEHRICSDKIVDLRQNPLVMLYLKKLPEIAVLLLLALSFWTCNRDTSGSVQIRLEHRVGDDALELSEMLYTAKAGHHYSVERLQYYISNVILHRTDGSVVEARTPHYREEGLEETATLLLPEVPNGRYDKISFIIGLDETTNKPHQLPHILQNINMEWPIPGEEGYHYMKFEGRYDSMGSGVIKYFNLHTGATHNIPFYVEVSLPLAGLNVDTDTWLLTLEMDLNEWLQNPNTYDFETFGPGIMANENAQRVLQENGATVFRVGTIRKE